jgi:hypothetical protein
MKRTFLNAVRKWGQGLLFGFRQSPNQFELLQLQSKIYYQASRHTMGLRGDYLEFGVYKGRTHSRQLKHPRVV